MHELHLIETNNNKLYYGGFDMLEKLCYNAYKNLLETYEKKPMYEFLNFILAF